MNDINWDAVYKLDAVEFSEDPDKYAEPELIYAIGDIRQTIQQKVRPSPVNGALARFDGNQTSQHFVGDPQDPHRKSTASDIFCEGIPFANYNAILASKFFKGIGIYLDTKGPDGKPWVMFHLDIRPFGFNHIVPLIWIVEKVYDSTLKKKVDKYRYPQADSKYWELFNDGRLYKFRTTG